MIQLCCLLVDNSGKPRNTPFGITISEKAFIHQLADVIQDHIYPHDRQSVPICWKLTPSINISSIPDELNSFDFNFKGPYERNGKALALWDSSQVSAYFPLTELKEDHVHVLVSLDSDEERVSKRRRLNEPESSPRHSLRVFWRTLWDAPQESIPFIELQDVVRDGTLKDIKVPEKCWTLSILDARTSSTLAFPLQTAVLREDYIVAIKQLFQDIGWDHSHIPDTLDIESPFKNPLWGCREQKLPQTEGYVLTGHPGIGKSIWLFVILVLRLHAKLPTIYQSSTNVLYFFSQAGVESKPAPNSGDFGDFNARNDKKVWGLVDSNLDLTSVHPSYWLTHVFAIQTPSPRADRLEWTKKASTTRFVLKPWSLSELILGRQFQTLAPSENNLALFLERYGPSAHLAYAPFSIDLYEKQLQMALSSLTLQDVRDALKNTPSSNFDHGISHQILTLHPTEDRSEGEVQITSHHIHKCLLNNLEKQVHNAAEELYLIFNRNSFTKDLCGELLEPAIHNLVDVGSAWSLFPMKLSTAPVCKHNHWLSAKTTPVSLCVDANGFSIQDGPVIPEAATFNHMKHLVFHTETSVLRSGYYRPLVSNQATFYGFIYRESDQHALLFQATVSSKHDMKEVGIEQLKDLGVKMISYIVITPVGTVVNLSVPPEGQGICLNTPYYQMELPELPRPGQTSNLVSQDR